MHLETDLYEIKRDLAYKGFSAYDVSNIQIKKILNPNDINSEIKRIRLPLFFVDLVSLENNKDIYKLDSLCYHKIKIEPPRKKNMCHKTITQKYSAKYLGMHLDLLLNWKHHVRQKKLQIKEKMRKLYRLVGRSSTLDLTSKRLLYIAIIKPTWTMAYNCEVVPANPTSKSFNAVTILLFVPLFHHTGSTGMKLSIVI